MRSAVLTYMIGVFEDLAVFLVLECNLPLTYGVGLSLHISLFEIEFATGFELAFLTMI